jgi:hypothetical protein
MKRHSTCNEAGLSATAIATNAPVKDLCVIIAGSKFDMVAPCNKHHCLFQEQ